MQKGNSILSLSLSLHTLANPAKLWIFRVLKLACLGHACSKLNQVSYKMSPDTLSRGKNMELHASTSTVMHALL